MSSVIKSLILSAASKCLISSDQGTGSSTILSGKLKASNCFCRISVKSMYSRAKWQKRFNFFLMLGPLTCEVCDGIEMGVDGNYDVSLLGAEDEAICWAVKVQNPG